MVWLTILALVIAAAVFLGQQDVFDNSPASSGIEGSGNAATETRHVAPFSTLDLAGSNNVIVHTGGKQSVVVHADDNLIDTVTTQVHGDRLVIGTAGSFTTKSPMHVDVTVPSLGALVLSGNGNLIADGIDVRTLKVTLAGNGVVRASGTAARLDISLKGSGDVQLGQLVARDAHAVVDASGRIAVNATNSLDAAVRGSGLILYSGSPAHVTKTVTGSGAIVGG
jgi:hypothetical protein